MSEVIFFLLVFAFGFVMGMFFGVALASIVSVSGRMSMFEEEENDGQGD